MENLQHTSSFSPTCELLQSAAQHSEWCIAWFEEQTMNLILHHKAAMISRPSIWLVSASQLQIHSISACETYIACA